MSHIARSSKSLCLALVAAGSVLLGWISDASAASGTLTGTARFWNENGNYCPSGADCTGSRYTQAEYATWKAIPNALIRIYSAAGAQIGQGSTSTDGTFSVSWSSATSPGQVRLRIFPYQKDTRFWIAQTDGLLYNVYTGLFTTAGGTLNIGTVSVGASGAPNAHFNAYWAGEKQWREMFNGVGLLQSNFTGVEVRGFADSIPAFRGTCTTSCASGVDNQVQLDANAALMPQARVMHELGHIASYALKTRKEATDYGWTPSSPPPGYDASGWGQGSYEWGMAGFEEAFATHGGNITWWFATAVAPTTCLSDSHCYNPLTWAPLPDTNIEATSYPHATNNCDLGASTPEARQPISQMRFLWDVHDDHNDADGDTYSANNGCYWCQFGVMGYYGSGTGTTDIDGPWNATRTALDDRDARGASAYAYHYGANFSNVSLLRTDNCTPP